MTVETRTPSTVHRLRKHADYQLVYKRGRKQFAKNIAYFYAVRSEDRHSDTAGAQVGLIAKEGDYALLKLPSGETRRVLVECMATIGQVGNTDHENVTIGKAGRNRWKGIRPSNRGVSMNPVDHPHGGGEGKTSGGRHPVTPWGQPTRGYKTRNNKRTDVFIVNRRSK